MQTADAVAFRHELTLSLAPEAVEVDLGIKPGSQEDPRTVYVELARKWTVDKDFEARHGEGESFADVQRRFLPFVREVMNRHAQDSGVVMIVAHAGHDRLHGAGARQQRAAGLCRAPSDAEHRHRQDRAARQPPVLPRLAGHPVVEGTEVYQSSSGAGWAQPTLAILRRCANSSGSWSP